MERHTTPTTASTTTGGHSAFAVIPPPRAMAPPRHGTPAHGTPAHGTPGLPHGWRARRAAEVAALETQIAHAERRAPQVSLASLAAADTGQADQAQ